MRIDEFSNAGEIDGKISTTEQSRFLLFGFDLGFSFSSVYREEVLINSPVLLRTSLSSPIIKDYRGTSSMTKFYSTTGPVTIIQRVSSPLI